MTDPESWSAVVESPPGLQEAARDIEEAVDRTIRPLVNQICDAYEIPDGRRDLGTRLAPDRLFTSEFTKRIMSIPRPELDFGDTAPLAGRFIAHAVMEGARGAATGLTPRLGGGMRGGMQAAVIGAVIYGLIAAKNWTAQTIDRQQKRRQALAEIAAIELPEETITMLERELAQEIARVVGERITPLERMVR